MFLLHPATQNFIHLTMYQCNADEDKEIVVQVIRKDDFKTHGTYWRFITSKVDVLRYKVF